MYESSLFACFLSETRKCLQAELAVAGVNNGVRNLDGVTATTKTLLYTTSCHSQPRRAQSATVLLYVQTVTITSFCGRGGWIVVK